ncbi:MAG: SPFH domain-containing protein [Lachnospiraceae bacterium]|nr:SPFH domain-containing protein [Lachnospiraceae bacterium]
MSLFSKPENADSNAKEHEGFLKSLQVDVIKWEPTGEEANEVVHKFRYEDFPNGSQLIVAPSQMAVFINNLTTADVAGGIGTGEAEMLTFVGPCRATLNTGDPRFAPFRFVLNSLTGGSSAFHSQVYFIDTTYMTDMSWGTTAPILMVDPVEEVNIHVRAYGVFAAHIEQSDENAIAAADCFLRRVVGTRASFSRNDLVAFMRGKILEVVATQLSKKIIEERVSILQISTKMSELSASLGESLREQFAAVGLTLDYFAINSINVPDDDLKAINDMKIQRKRSQLEAEGNAMKLDIESEAKVRQREREGYDYRQEKTFDVMTAAAENHGSTGGLSGLGVELGMASVLGNVMKNEMDAAMNSQNSGNSGNGSGESGSAKAIICENCKSSNPAGSGFCYICGERLVVEKCAKCGAKLLPGAKFCNICGAKVEKKRVCSCGTELPDGAKFCHECGAKIED